MNEEIGLTDEDANEQETGRVNCQRETPCCVPEEVQKEIDRIKRVAEIYMKLQSLMPGYESKYMDAFVELANRFDKVGTQRQKSAAGREPAA